MLRSDPRIHYKMYKAKKNMVYAALFSFAVLGGLGLSQNAKADTVENNNVTPTVQTAAVTSQSTATPQSSAADVNAVNSTPTAQPVSAQPVVNSQANSASNAGDQTQITTLNVQSGQPAQKFAVTRRANLYAQSLAQTNQGVSNVQGRLTNASGSDDSTINIRPGQDQSMTRHFSLNLDFDVDASQIKANQSYQIGQVSTTYDNNGHFVPVWNNEYSVPFSINNQKYGSIQLASSDSLKSQTISVHFDRDADSNMTGLQHISVNMPGIIVIGYNMSPLVIPSGQDSVLNDKLQLINNQHQVLSEKTLNIYKATIKYATDPLYENGDGFGATGASHSNLTHNFTPTVDGDGDLNKLANGEQVNVRQMPDVIEVGGRIAAEGNEILPQHTFVHKDVYIPVYHSDGKRSNDFIDAGPWTSTSEWPKYPAVNLGDGLTLDQMKQASYTGLGYSLQTDHSYLYLIKVPSKDMQADEDTLKKAVREHSWQLAADSDPDKALQITFDKFDQGLKLYEFQTDVPIADPTVPAKLTITRLYSNYLSNPNQNSTVSTTTYPISSMASGQAAVKLHVINATNGTELNQWRKLVSEARNKKNSSQ